ncbi:dynein regulatory complex subunit 2-like isoform X1 [Seriola aureovittata]|uniref:dynein regulatory complex subunit 2-like isoform X1 n=2 Tax=Seriola aureovittata TaxID=2871759 RepID=UPI0024BDC3C4|nr:dynein regulatory complex subunit 2-like isoform X1 [Seriola aureovittata]
MNQSCCYWKLETEKNTCYYILQKSGRKFHGVFSPVSQILNRPASAAERRGRGRIMPKKAKKSGGRKGSGFLQDRAQAEEEEARKREETLTQFLKDKLEKEEKNTAVNLLKVGEGWRAILLQTQDPEFREEIKTFRQTFESEMAGLDSIINDLARDLQEKARQSTRGRQVHLQRLERLWALHEKRMMTVQQHWENGMQQLSSRFNYEWKGQSQQQLADLKNTTRTVEQNYKEVMDEIQALHTGSISSYNDALRAQKLSHDNEKTQKEKTVETKEGLQFCRKKQQQLDKMVYREQQYIQQTAEMIKAVKGLQDKVIHVRGRLKSIKTENKPKEQDLATTVTEVNKKTDKLSKQLNENRSVARKQLIDLSAQSNKTAKKLQAMIAKGEKVLRVAEMCRKLEIKHEEVLSSLSSAADNQRSMTEGEEEEKETSEFPELMRRMNTALLVRDTLKKQKQDLRQQNQQLRRQLRQQVDDMSVSDSTLDGHDAPLAVSKVPTTAVPPITNRRSNDKMAVSHTASPQQS